MAGSVKVIVGSLVANLAIASAKGIAAVFTGSGAMFAEAIHSSADCFNQILLLVGAKQAEKPPTEKHPLGFGRSSYFWSFLVALMIFFGGGVFSIQEGLHKVMHPEAVENFWIGAGVLGVALVIEFAAMIQAQRAINEKRGEIPFVRYLRETTDADLIVLFAENAAAVLGLLFALLALILAEVTHDGRWDGIGSIVVGVLLVLVAWFLATEVKSLIDGERADPVVETAVRAEAKKDPRIVGVLRVVSLQQGPSQVIVAAKIAIAPNLTIQESIDLVNQLEENIRKARPEVKWQFIEVDNKA